MNPTNEQFQQLLLQEILEVKLLVLLFSEAMAKGSTLDKKTLDTLYARARKLARREVPKTIDIFMANTKPGGKL